jgi:hypothetical protein
MTRPSCCDSVQILFPGKSDERSNAGQRSRHVVNRLCKFPKHSAAAQETTVKA